MLGEVSGTTAAVAEEVSRDLVPPGLAIIWAETSVQQPLTPNGSRISPTFARPIASEEY